MTDAAYLLLWFTVFATPWQQVLQVPGVGTIARLSGIAAFALWTLAAARGGALRRPAAFHVLAMAFVVWSGLTIFWTVDGAATAERFWSYLQLAVLVWLIWELAPTRERHLQLLQAYVCGAYVSALAIVGNYLAGHPLVTRGGVVRPRFAPPGFNPNDVAFLLVLALPIAWHLAITSNRPALRWFNRAYLVLALLAILLTGSRSALLLTPVALSIVPWTLPRLRPRTRIVMLVIVAVAAAVAWKYVSPAAMARLATTRAELTEGTLNNREVIWEAGLHLLPRHPIGGVGAGGFERAVVPYLGSEKTGHNTYLAVLLEQGLVGLALFLLVLVSAFLHVRAAVQPDRRFYTILLVTLCLGLTPRTWQAEKQTWILLALALSAAPAVEARPAPHRTSRPVLPGGAPLRWSGGA